MRNFILKTHLGLTGLVQATAVIQFILAGLGVFGAMNYSAHVLLGRAIWFSSLLLVLLSLLGRRGRAISWFSLLLAILMLIQSILVHSGPWIAALHPAVGVSILFAAWKLLRLGIHSLQAKREAARG